MDNRVMNNDDWLDSVQRVLYLVFAHSFDPRPGEMSTYREQEHDMESSHLRPSQSEVIHSCGGERTPQGSGLRAGRDPTMQFTPSDELS